MVSLKENAGTVITRDKRRAAGSDTRICPSNHGKHRSLRRAPRERKSFASSSRCCCQDPQLCKGTRTWLCLRVPRTASNSLLLRALSAGHPKHPRACPSLPTGLRHGHPSGSCVDALGASLPSPARGRKSRAEHPAGRASSPSFAQLGFYALLSLYLVPLFFLLHHASRLPSEGFPGSQGFGRSLVSAAVRAGGQRGCASPGCGHRPGSPPVHPR